MSSWVDQQAYHTIDSASEVIGVFAHETAHIADGHMIRTVDAIENAQMQTLLGTLLGGVVGLAAGQPDLAVGMILGNMEMAKGIFLKHSRVQEGAADQGALRYLDKLGWSANGLLSFMRKLQAYDPRRLSDDIYLYTHPLTQERVAAFLHHVQQKRAVGQVTSRTGLLDTSFFVYVIFFEIKLRFSIFGRL